jgi:hypothetical protein
MEKKNKLLNEIIKSRNYFNAWDEHIIDYISKLVCSGNLHDQNNFEEQNVIFHQKNNRLFIINKIIVLKSDHDTHETKCKLEKSIKYMVCDENENSAYLNHYKFNCDCNFKNSGCLNQFEIRCDLDDDCRILQLQQHDCLHIVLTSTIIDKKKEEKKLIKEMQNDPNNIFYYVYDDIIEYIYTYL